MKIRQGFVSNSSSSSFTMFLRKTTYDEAITHLLGIERDVISRCAGDDMMGNEAFVTIHSSTDMGGYGTMDAILEDMDIENDEDCDKAQDAIYTFEALIKKKFPGTFIIRSE